MPPPKRSQGLKAQPASRKRHPPHEDPTEAVAQPLPRGDASSRGAPRSRKIQTRGTKPQLVPEVESTIERDQPGPSSGRTASKRRRRDLGDDANEEDDVEATVDPKVLEVYNTRSRSKQDSPRQLKKPKYTVVAVPSANTYALMEKPTRGPEDQLAEEAASSLAAQDAARGPHSNRAASDVRRHPGRADEDSTRATDRFGQGVVPSSDDIVQSVERDDEDNEDEGEEEEEEGEEEGEEEEEEEVSDQVVPGPQSQSKGSPELQSSASELRGSQPDVHGGASYMQRFMAGQAKPPIAAASRRARQPKPSYFASQGSAKASSTSDGISRRQQRQHRNRPLPPSDIDGIYAGHDVPAELDDIEEEDEGSDEEAEAPEEEDVPASAAVVHGEEVAEAHGEEAETSASNRPPDATINSTLNQASSLLWIPTSMLGNILNAMQWAAWSGLQNQWEKKLLRADEVAQSRTPPLSTRLGQRCWVHLYELRRVYEEAPRAPDFAALNQFLHDNDEELGKRHSTIDKLVDSISAKHQARHSEDLTKYLIPLLTLVLKAAFSLGGRVESEGEHNGWLLPQECVFTASAVSHVESVLGWLDQLDLAMRAQMDQHLQGPSTPSKPTLNKSHDNQRLLLHGRLKKIDSSIEDAIAKQQAAQIAAELRQQRLANEETIRQARRLKADKARILSEQKWSVFAASTQRLRQAPNPMREEFKKAIQGWNNNTNAYSGKAPLAPSNLRLVSGSSQLQRPQPSQPPPSSVLFGLPWERDEEKWLMLQLRRSDGYLKLNVWAQTLDREVEDVRQKVKLLQRAFRTLARETGAAPERWAMN